MSEKEQVFTNMTNGGPISVYVKDGKITRVRPMQIADEDYKPWTIEADGKKYSPPKAVRLAPPSHAERNKTNSFNRVLYPMKRVDFDPNGERNPQNRGKSGYEQISWEEALDIVSGEMTRLIDKHGGSSITGMTSSHHNWGVVGYKMGPFSRFMNMLDYTPVIDNPDSWEGWHWGATHTYGFFWRLGMPEQFDLLEDALKHTKMIVFWSNDPDTTRGTYSGQESAIWRQWLKEKGIKTVFIDPFFNYTNATMDGTWMPPRPGSDTALAMAIAYTWITEGTYDKEYIVEKTLGFDEFKEYILGVTDNGVAKTPAWAAEKSGIPERRIKALAREWAAVKTSVSCGSRGGEGGACRTADGTEWARMMVCLQAMQGLGKPGISIWGTTMGAPADSDTWFPAYAEPQGMMGKADIAKRKLSNENKTKQRLFRLSLPEAIISGKEEFHGEGFCGQSLDQQFTEQRYPIEGPARMFYRYGGSFFGTMVDTSKWVKMYQSANLETVVAQDCWWSGETKFADIILPACTNLERNDIGEWAACGGYTTNAHIGNNYRVIARQQKCIEPIGESKSDYEIFTLLADRLGKKDLFTEGNTEDDWAKLFFESSDVAKDVTWEEFNEKGYHVVPVPEKYKPTPSMRWFAEGREVDTPDTGNPKRHTEKAKELGTYSGKIEFVSVSLMENTPDDTDRAPMPQYKESWEGYKSDMHKKYGLQLISPHPRFSFHTHYDNHCSWINEIPLHRIEKDGYQWWPMRINPADAKVRNIQSGDIVEMYNDRGRVLGAAVVTERVPAGTLHSYASSAKYDPVVAGDSTSPDKAGCVAVLTPSRRMSKRVPGMAPNSCVCEIKKWEA
jgi:molybdopterin guanine dinucleotide-containing S/N-oxide reductase-like protein